MHGPHIHEWKYGEPKKEEWFSGENLDLVIKKYTCIRFCLDCHEVEEIELKEKPAN